VALKNRRRDLTVISGFAVLVFLAFSSAVQGGFVYDDKGQIVYDPRITAWRYVPQYCYMRNNPTDPLLTFGSRTP